MMVFCKLHVFPPSQCVRSEMSIMRFQVCLSDNVSMSNQNLAAIFGAGTVTITMSMTETESLVRRKMFSGYSQIVLIKTLNSVKYIYIYIRNFSAKIISRTFRCSQMRSQSICQKCKYLNKI